MDAVGIIKDIGFPIAAFVLMYLLHKETLKSNTESQLNYATALTDLKVTLETNTQVLKSLHKRIDEELK